VYSSCSSFRFWTLVTDINIELSQRKTDKSLLMLILLVFIVTFQRLPHILVTTSLFSDYLTFQQLPSTSLFSNYLTFKWLPHFSVITSLFNDYKTGGKSRQIQTDWWNNDTRWYGKIIHNLFNPIISPDKSRICNCNLKKNIIF